MTAAEEGLGFFLSDKENCERDTAIRKTGDEEGVQQTALASLILRNKIMITH